MLKIKDRYEGVIERALKMTVSFEQHKNYNRNVKIDICLKIPGQNKKEHIMKYPCQIEHNKRNSKIVAEIFVVTPSLYYSFPGCNLNRHYIIFSNKKFKIEF